MKYCAEASFEDRTFESNAAGKRKSGRRSHLNNTDEFIRLQAEVFQ